jgi:hypothetical protein
MGWRVVVLPFLPPIRVPCVSSGDVPVLLLLGSEVIMATQVYIRGSVLIEHQVDLVQERFAFSKCSDIPHLDIDDKANVKLIDSSC